MSVSELLASLSDWGLQDDDHNNNDDGDSTVHNDDENKRSQNIPPEDSSPNIVKLMKELEECMANEMEKLTIQDGDHHFTDDDAHVAFPQHEEDFASVEDELTATRLEHSESPDTPAAQLAADMACLEGVIGQDFADDTHRAFPQHEGGSAAIAEDELVEIQPEQKESSNTLAAPITADMACLEGLVVPSHLDILCGRGRCFQDHPGNLHLKHVIKQHLDEYNTLRRKAKTALSAHIVRLVQGRQGRFLKKDADGKGAWIVIDDFEARDKVAHGFRKKREMDAKKGKKTAEPCTPLSRGDSDISAAAT